MGKKILQSFSRRRAFFRPTIVSAIRAACAAIATVRGWTMDREQAQKAGLVQRSQIRLGSILKVNLS